MKKIDLSGALFFGIKIEKLRLGPLEIDALGKFPTAPARFKNRRFHVHGGLLGLPGFRL